MNKDQISERLYAITSQATQSAAAAMVGMGIRDKPELLYTSLNGVNGALMAACIFIARHNFPPDADSFSDDKKKELVADLIKPETLMFTALLAVVCLEDLDAKNVHMEMGPEQYWEAVQMWEKLYPDADITKYIEPKLVEAARAVSSDAGKVFQDFLKRNNISPSSGSVN